MGHFDTPWNDQQTLLEVDHNGWHNAASAQLRGEIGNLEENAVQIFRRRDTGFTGGFLRYNSLVPEIVPVADFSVPNTYYFLEFPGSDQQNLFYDAGGRLYPGQPVSNVYWGGVTFPPNTSFQLEKGVWSWNIQYRFNGPPVPDTFIQGYFDYVSDYSTFGTTAWENEYNITSSSELIALDAPAHWSNHHYNTGIITSTSDTECFVAPQFLVVSGSGQPLKLRSVWIVLQKLVAGI